MALQFRRNTEEESSEESDEDYLPPEHVEVDDGDSESGEADLEPSSGGDTDLDVGKRKRKRRTRIKGKNSQRGKKKARPAEFSDGNDETTSNETLVSLPLRTTVTLPAAASTDAATSASTNNYSSSSPSPITTPPRPIPRFEPHMSSSEKPSAIAEEASLDSSTPSSSRASNVPSSPAPVQSGLQSMLAKLSGKKKQSTLEKSQLAWNQYKESNDLSDELTQHNKGKSGYLDRQDFLQRANIREYESGQARPAARRSNNP